MEPSKFFKSPNLLETLPNITPPKPANPTISNTHQAPIQNVVNSHSDANMPSKKDIARGKHTESDEKKDVNFKINIS